MRDYFNKSHHSLRDKRNFSKERQYNYLKSNKSEFPEELQHNYNSFL